MSNSAATKELPVTSIWHGAVSQEDVQLVRRRHQEKVEEWLDFADFATELFKLHEKYGIEEGEAGYFAYRKHLRTNYYQKLETYGSTPDPLDEGCDCIFCKMHPKETPAEPASEEHELPKATPPNQHSESRLEQVPAEAPTDSNQHNHPTQSPQELGPVPAYDQYEYDEEYERVAGDTSRYDSVGGVELDWGEQNLQPGPIVPIYPLNPSPPPSPYSKEKPTDADRREERQRRETKYGPDPVYVKTAGEKAWLKKMSGSVF
ncbi:MAG: hypothetical protein NXI22_20330 [bacterium]|nr:hypothetical protein [bacterium]